MQLFKKHGNTFFLRKLINFQLLILSSDIIFGIPSFHVTSLPPWKFLTHKKMLRINCWQSAHQQHDASWFFTSSYPTGHFTISKSHFPSINLSEEDITRRPTDFKTLKLQIVSSAKPQTTASGFSPPSPESPFLQDP